jgi:hypothetical protein
MTNSIAERLRPRKITMAESKVPNLNLAFSGQELGSPKANAFAGYMVGDPRVPMDVHGLFGGGSFQEKIDAEYSALRHLMTAREGLPFKKSLDEHGMYKRFEEAVVKAILPLDPTRGQNQIWGTLWEGIRDYKGLPYQGGPVDILRVKKLLGEGAMLDKDFLRWTLKQGGWTAGAIAGLMAAMPDSPAMVPSHAQPGAAGAADESAPQTLGEQ